MVICHEPWQTGCVEVTDKHLAWLRASVIIVIIMITFII
jgi:hypothetical protein